jgi:hypothetical protein
MRRRPGVLIVCDNKDTADTRENFEISLRVITEKIKQSCFAH